MIRKMMYDILGKILHKLALIKDDYLLNAMQKELGHNEGTISLKCHFKWPQHISIGKNSYINGGYIFAGPNSYISIGDNCLISYNVHLRTESHNYINKDILIREQGGVEKSIIVEDDVWIGFGAQVMGGVTLKRGSVIGAGAVVTHDTEEYGVYAGVPARLIKYRQNM